MCWTHPQIPIKSFRYSSTSQDEYGCYGIATRDVYHVNREDEEMQPRRKAKRIGGSLLLVALGVLLVTMPAIFRNSEDDVKN